MAAAPEMFDLLVQTLSLLQDGNSDEYDADKLEYDITELLTNLERPLW